MTSMESTLDAQPHQAEDISPSELARISLAAILHTLKPKEQKLLEAWFNCGCDKGIAQALETTPTAAKLRRERLVRRIKTVFQE